jgi:hypothetical protein
LLVLSRAGQRAARVYDPGMDLIVCGDFASISCGTWVSFWNGAIGAFVAAVVGGYVALRVVQWTGEQEKRHAADAREIAAVADVIAVAETMALHWRDESHETDELFMKFRAALLRLRLAGPDTEVIWTHTNKWPELLAEQSESARDSAGLARLATAMTMVSSVQRLADALVLWTRDGKKSREQSVKQLVIATNILKKSTKKDPDKS